MGQDERGSFEGPIRIDIFNPPRYMVRVECFMAQPEWRFRPPYGGAWVVWDTQKKRIPAPIEDHIFDSLVLREAFECAQALNNR